MNYDEEEVNDLDGDETGKKPFTIMHLNRIVAILFVLSVYIFIFLKILILD